MVCAAGGQPGRAAWLRQRRDFQRVSRDGVRRTTRSVVALAAQRPEWLPAEPRLRLGITASRKVGNAVARNAAKRRIREWYREAHPRLLELTGDEGPAIDVVVIARRRAAEDPHVQVGRDLDRAVLWVIRSVGSAREERAAGERRV